MTATTPTTPTTPTPTTAPTPAAPTTPKAKAPKASKPSVDVTLAATVPEPAPAFSVLGLAQPASGKVLALVNAAMDAATALGLGALVAGIDRPRLATAVGAALAANDSGKLTAKGGRTASAFDWSKVGGLTDRQIAVLGCAGSVLAASAKLAKAL